MLPTPREILERFPVPLEVAQFVAESRQVIERICLGKENRLLLIVGPCSIHNIESGLEYAHRLKEIAERAPSCFIVMRAYLEKPRTQQGWRGLIHDPYLNESYAMEEGLSMARHFLLKLAELKVPAATEFVTPQIAPYIEDLVSWGCIGARTCTSQPHRLLASALPMPVGFKNSIDGNVDCAIHALLTARMPQTFMHLNDEGKLCKVTSKGNLASHIVLRGAQNRPNSDSKNINQVLAKLRQLELTPRLIVDCAHGNCQKDYLKQKEVFYQQLTNASAHVCGLMLEGHLEAGRQPHIPGVYPDPNISITDACLDLSSIESLILAASTSSVSSFS